MIIYLQKKEITMELKTPLLFCSISLTVPLNN